MCDAKKTSHVNGGQSGKGVAEGVASADLEARTPIGMSGNLLNFSPFQTILNNIFSLSPKWQWGLIKLVATMVAYPLPLTQQHMDLAWTNTLKQPRHFAKAALI